MSKLKDRGPGCAGFRSFLSLKQIGVLSMLICVCLHFYATRMVLAVLPEEGKQPFVYSTHKGDTWHISLTHSVERTLWEEFFRVEGIDKMTMTHTTFESLGWGFPYAPEDGKLTHRKDGRYEVVMNRPFTSVPLRISVQAMQHFHHGKTDLDLCQIYGQGTKLDIKVMYRYQYWLAVYCK